MKNFYASLLYGLVILVFFGLPLSLYRYIDMGFQPVFALHIVLGLLVLGTYVFKETLPEKTPVVLAIMVFSLIALGGVFNYGIVSQFLVYANLGAILITVAYSLRSAIYYTVAVICVILVFSYLYSFDVMHYPIDLNIYATSINIWILVLIGAIISNVFTLTAIHFLQEKLKQTADELDEEKKKVEDIANNDHLTSLYSRRFLTKNIQQLIEISHQNNSKFALIFIDLDNFKRINDTYGHDIGDIVLVETANRLKSHSRKHDMVGRMGGDEFLVIMPDLDNLEMIEKFCSRINTEIKKPILHEGENYYIEGSIGISLYPSDGLSCKALLKSADIAMYTVKNSGRDGHVFFDQIS